MTARRMIATGRVQGVGYRGWVKREARRLGLVGWVRNRRDGSVEILAAGDAALLDRLEARCRLGPPTSRVDAVAIQEAPDVPDTASFDRRPTV